MIIYNSSLEMAPLAPGLAGFAEPFRVIRPPELAPHHRRASSRRFLSGTPARKPATDASVRRIAGLFLAAMPSCSHGAPTCGANPGPRGVRHWAGRQPMPGMKVTVSAAMRARDVSRPKPHHVAAAEENSAAARPVPGPRTGTTPRAGSGPGPARNSEPGQAVAPVPSPAPQRPARPGPRPDDSVRPERGKSQGAGGRPGPAPGIGGGKPGPGGQAAVPGGRRPEAAPAPSRDPRPQQEPAPGREVPRPRQPDEPRVAVTASGPARPGNSAGGEPARGRPAKRKRVRRRRSHGR